MPGLPVWRGYKRDTWKQKTPWDQLVTIRGAIEDNALLLNEPTLTDVGRTSITTRIIEFNREIENLEPFLKGELLWNEPAIEPTEPVPKKRAAWTRKTPSEQLVALRDSIDSSALLMTDQFASEHNRNCAYHRIIEMSKQIGELEPFLKGEAPWDEPIPAPQLTEREIDVLNTLVEQWDRNGLLLPGCLSYQDVLDLVEKFKLDKPTELLKLVSDPKGYFAGKRG